MESKLPDFVQRDWLIFMVGPSNNVTSDNHFDILLKFLKKHIIEKKDTTPYQMAEDMLYMLTSISFSRRGKKR